MHVGVERPFGGQPVRGGPELPPVEVPAQALEDVVGRKEPGGGPGAPALFVGPAEVAEVVDLKPRGAAQVARLEDQPASIDLGELELFGVTAQGGARRIEACSAVRPLVVMHGVLLGGGDGLPASVHPAEVEGSRKPVVVSQEPVLEVHRTHIGVVVEVGGAPGVQVPVHHGDNAPNAAVAVPVVLVCPEDEVVGPGLQRGVGRGPRPGPSPRRGAPARARAGCGRRAWPRPGSRSRWPRMRCRRSRPGSVHRPIRRE